MGDDLDDPVAEEEGEGIVLQQQQRLPWEGSDRDYEYDELLGRVFGFLQNYASGARALVAKGDDGGTGEGYACEFYAGVVEKETLEIEMRNGKGAETQG
ncbi:hypothetical protein LguiA_008216 [Lonicera macranthoides]